MSLIFTSNTQDDYKTLDEDDKSKLLSARIGIESPADYHNHLTSPLEVKPNSQIAVQSVKITREELFDVADSDHLLYYHGTPLGDTLDLYDTTQRPNLITIPQGVYDKKELGKELSDQLNAQPLPPCVYNNFAVNVSLVDNVFQGYSISASNRGTGFTDKHASLDTSIADITHAIGNVSPSGPSNNFTLSGGVFTRTGASGTIKDELCCGIATDFPLSNGSGSRFQVDLRGASYSDGEGGFLNSSWAIGLTRPTIQTNNTNRYINFGNAPVDYIYTKSIVPHYYDYVVVFDAEDGTSASGTLKIFQAAYDLDEATDTFIPNTFKFKEIVYFGGTGQIATSITNASINGTGGGTYFNLLDFEIVGDEVRVAVLKTDGSTYQPLISSTQNANASRSFKPLSDFTCALYPKMCLSRGSLTVSRYDTYSVTNQSYLYPTFAPKLSGANIVGGTYTIGDSPYGNYVARSKLVQGQDYIIKQEAPLWMKRGNSLIFNPDLSGALQLFPDPATSIIVNSYDLVNASGGVDYQHVLILEDTPQNNPEDGDFGNYYSKMCNMSVALGFPNNSILEQSDGTVILLNRVVWESSEVPEVLVNSAFVRISNLNHRTYNSCKNSVSKMLYHVPRFTNDGRQFGDLFWEVAEKTYVDLNNTESFMLNQLQVQIVDKNERIVKDLKGDTIVVFHIKQK